MANKRRTYANEFEAVELDTEQGRSIAETARSFGIGENLRSWKIFSQATGDQAFPGEGRLPALEEELRRLRADNKRLAMERDILKEATAFFASEATWLRRAVPCRPRRADPRGPL